ncbi:MAG TPA: hypothetical protein DGO89_04600 [Microcoleaceae bacterium UBA9251]|nr:hypothetical protein [Microcoleaceae cyanobacterium UBA9251]
MGIGNGEWGMGNGEWGMGYLMLPDLRLILIIIKIIPLSPSPSPHLPLSYSPTPHLVTIR